MAVGTDEWLDLMQREYLRRFVPSGGSAIKFVVGTDAVLEQVARRLQTLATERRLHFVAIDTAATKLHMIQDIFFAIARSIDWNVLAQRWVEAVFRKHQFEWPRPGQAVPVRQLAEANRLDETLLKREVLQWLSTYILQDKEMAQDFRAAMTDLCMRRMEMADSRTVAPVIEWLRGELRTIGAVKQVPISGKITRHNGRAMLRSLCHWLRLSGGPGLGAMLDVRQLGKTGPAAGEGVRYSAAAVLDAFEVLRQLIDDCESFKGLFLTVLGDPGLIEGDPKRSIGAYRALQERIWSDVHAQGHENPLAPLLQLSIDPASSGKRRNGSDGGEIPYGPDRVAIEALRAGVPNRAAVQRLGTGETALCDAFLERLGRSRAEAHAVVEGQIISGAFGSGKSHLLGFLAEKALRENFIVSVVTISKETPLFDPQRLYAAAVRNATVPGVNDDVMTAAIKRLDGTAIGELETWASGASLPLFAALLFLLPKQVLTPEDVASIARFFAGSRISMSKVRQWLRAAGALKIFDLKPVKAPDLTLQRLQFAPRLFRAAGFSGWCILLDELELVGRYSTLQRGKSYAELARWLGLTPEAGIPGVIGVGAITDDFTAALLRGGRLDEEKVPRALEAKNLGRQARLAEIAMRAIARTAHFLSAPSEERLRDSQASISSLYDRAYGWSPTGGEIGERRTGKSVRLFIKSWITDWDIRRLYGASAEITTETLEGDYTENTDLEKAPEPEPGEDESD